MEIARIEGFCEEIYDLLLWRNMASDDETFGDLITNDMVVDLQVFRSFVEHWIWGDV